MDPIPTIVTDYLAAYNARDVAGMVRCLSDDVHFVNMSGGAVSAETNGIDAFTALAHQGVAVFAQRTQTVTNCIACNGHVTLRIDYRAMVAVDLPNGWKAGQEIRLDGVSVFTLRNGTITELVDIS